MAAAENSYTRRQILLFGDLSLNHFEDQLRRLLHVKTSPFLTSFVERAGYGLRKLIGTLPAQQQALFPHFTTLIDLLARLAKTEGTPVLRFFFLSVHQIAQFLVYYGVGSRLFPSPTDTYVVGTCTGGFAASAVASSQNLSDVVSNGVQAVLAAFRTALCSCLMGHGLCQAASSEPRSWSALVSGPGEVAIEKLVDEYVEKSSLLGSPLWISASSLSKLKTLSGRPSVLQDFVTELSTASSFNATSIDIESPYHAAHLFSTDDVEEIIGQIERTEKASTGKTPGIGIPLISSSTGRAIRDPSFKNLLRVAIKAALRKPIRWNLVIESISELLSVVKADECTILPFSSSAAPMLSTALVKRTASLQIGIQEVSTILQDTTELLSEPTGRFEHSKIAIVGYSGRFPSAASNEAFWELLRAGRDVHRDIPPDRFDWKTHFDPTGKKKNTSRVKHGCFIDEPGVFDTRFFNMSPREAENTDPAQRLAIMTAYEAMEMAGMVRNRTPSTQQDRVGVFYGTTSDDWREVNSGQNVGTYFIPGGNRAFIPGRISYFFRFSGPSLSIDTACSSSFAAIQAACSNLWRGDCDTAIAGGTNILTNPDNFAGLDQGHFLSTTGNCNPFDDEASGYCRSDAVGSVILKRLEDAETDNDPIFGVIVGTNTNHCGHTDSITRPHEGDQASVFNRIIRYANIDPLDVGYIECHGTGTQSGDLVEAHSVLSVFAPERTRTTTSGSKTPGPLFLGSAKANIGHAESASGVSSLIKVLMMMKHNEIPPHCGIKTRINHNYPKDLAERGVHIAFKPTLWQCQGQSKRMAFLNNFSAAGGNTAILLQDSPRHRQMTAPKKDARPVHMVAVTAKSPKSLTANIQSLVVFLEKSQSVSLPALAYTTTARRTHYPYRTLVSATDIASILAELKTRASYNQTSDVKPIPNQATKKRRVVFVFSGQGTLYAGLGQTLYETDSAFRASITRLDRSAQVQGFPSFVGLIDGTVAEASIRAQSAVVTQLAHLCIQLALTDLWSSWGVEPAAVIGHSLGEYAALYASGVISLADAVLLVGTRASLLEERSTAGTHSMLAVKAPIDVAQQLIRETATDCELACANQPDSQCIAGPMNSIEDLGRIAATRGVETVQLEVPYAFHSAQVDPILADFERVASKSVVFHPPSVPVVSPLLGKTVPAGGVEILNASYLASACRSIVNFHGALRAAAADHELGLGNADRIIWLEIGPHPVCSGMIKGILDQQSTTVATLRKSVDAYKTLASAIEVLYLAGVDISWNEYHRPFPASHEVLELPMYAWDLKNYWIQYRHDFCLTKGDNPMAALPALAPCPGTKTRPARKYISPCAQEVVMETHGNDKSELVVESDIFDKRLVPVFQGHLVNGAALCPSSMYADLALTMARYLLSHRSASVDLESTGLEVNNVVVENPLIGRSTEIVQRFRGSANADWDTNMISLTIFSVDNSGKRTASHARLEVQVVPRQRWLAEWKRNTHLITSRIDFLTQNIHRRDGLGSHLIKRGMAYKLFGALVQYSPDYQGMTEVVLDSSRLEAVATVEFQVGDQGFHLNPRWIDSAGHIAGFIMNANDAVDSKMQVFINHGWERMRIAEPLQAGKTYQAYNRMQLVDEKKVSYAGDTYVLDNGRIIAIFEGVTFQGVPRRVLDRLLPASGGSSHARPPVQSPSPAIKSSAVMAPSHNKPSTTSPQPIKQAKFDSQPSSGPEPSGVLGRILAVIGQEIGVEPHELKADTNFAELGIDSLLSLTILSKIREELGLDLPPALFMDCPTVGELQLQLQVWGENSGKPQPLSRSCSDVNDGQVEVLSQSQPNTGLTTPADDPLGASGIGQVLRQVVAEETGVAMSDLTPSTSLTNIGMDSLLGLTITARLQELLDIHIGGSMLMEYETLAEVEGALCKTLGYSGQPSPLSNAVPSDNLVSSSRPVIGSNSSLSHQPQACTDAPNATSILLSGSPKTCQAVLFLFPDGSGSAASYTAVAPSIDPSTTAVYGLNCPWRKAGSEMSRLGISMSEMVAKYVVEVQRILSTAGFAKDRMPSIAVGGWSAGGILATEATRQLQEQHATKVSRLVLFDSPDPIGLQNPPQRMYDFFDSLGVFGGGPDKAPEWLREHFDAFIRILDAYEPRPLRDAPPSLIVYARDGVCKDPNGPKMETRPDDPREMLWLLNNRTDFSAEGWRSVIGRERLEVEVVDEVDHFSIMDQGPKMVEMGRAVSGFLSG